MNENCGFAGWPQGKDRCKRVKGICKGMIDNTYLLELWARWKKEKLEEINMGSGKVDNIEVHDEVK